MIVWLPITPPKTPQPLVETSLALLDLHCASCAQTTGFVASVASNQYSALSYRYSVSVKKGDSSRKYRSASSISPNLLSSALYSSGSVPSSTYFGYELVAVVCVGYLFWIEIYQGNTHTPRRLQRPSKLIAYRIPFPTILVLGIEILCFVRRFDTKCQFSYAGITRTIEPRPRKLIHEPVLRADVLWVF